MGEAVDRRTRPHIGGHVASPSRRPPSPRRPMRLHAQDQYSPVGLAGWRASQSSWRTCCFPLAHGRKRPHLRDLGAAVDVACLRSGRGGERSLSSGWCSTMPSMKIRIWGRVSVLVIPARAAPACSPPAAPRRRRRSPPPRRPCALGGVEHCPLPWNKAIRRSTERQHRIPTMTTTRPRQNGMYSFVEGRHAGGRGRQLAFRAGGSV